MFKKRLGITLMLVCVLAATATEAFAAEVFSFEAVYAGSGQPAQPDPPKVKPAKPKAENPPPAESYPEEIWVWAPEQTPEEPQLDAEVQSTEPEKPAEPEEDFPYDLETFAAEVLRLTNEARAEAGAPALETDPILTQMAQARMEETGGKLSHIRPDGTTPDTIFREYDTQLTCTGEIIMSTSRSPQAIVNGFLASPSHRANLLDPNHKYAGIGVAWERPRRAPPSQSWSFSRNNQQSPHRRQPQIMRLPLFYVQNQERRPAPMKRPARFLSLLMAVMMLVSSAVPAYAFEGLGEISNVTDYGEDVPSVTEEDEDAPTPEEGEEPEEEPTSSSESQPDTSEPPVVDTGEPPEESEGETLPGDADAPLPTEPTVGASGLDPPDSFSFEAVRSGSAAPSGMRKARANPGSTTIYMEKISGLSHLYPFSGGTTYSAYKCTPRMAAPLSVWSRHALTRLTAQSSPAASVTAP